MGECQEQRVVIPPWFSEGDLNLVESLHEIHKILEKIIPEFDPNMPSSLKDHVRNLFLVIHLLNF